VKPIYSEANLNCDKNKLERFLLPGSYSVATVFGPACYQPCPLLAFKRSATTGALELFATGSLGNVNPDRIVLKKVILTGVPIRVKKKFGVVKHLFYDPQVGYYYYTKYNINND
jgi:pre-rRNA-processing protein TSR1